jgi:DNA-binding MarR family transcriptional regulator
VGWHGGGERGCSAGDLSQATTHRAATYLWLSATPGLVRQAYHQRVSASSESLLPGAQDLGVDLEALRLAIVRLERKLRKNAGAMVTPSQLSALSVLHRLGPMRLSELAEREQISKSTVTRLADRLEEKGLAGRRPDETDARSQTISLTDTGLQLVESAAERSSDYLRQRVQELDAADVDRLVGAIGVLQRLAGATR